MTNELLKATNINKSFSGAVALSKVDFSLKTGEVHALLGGNGAGKSTLVKCITGVYQPDSGNIQISGEDITALSPQEIQHKGISTVHQEINLVPNLSVTENIYLSYQPKKLGCIHWHKMHKMAKDALGKIGIDIDVTKNLSEYSVAIQQMIAICRGINMSAKVLILDEPTASLDKDEIWQLFDVMRRLTQENVGIIFITHFLDQVYEISDRISILRNGHYVGTYETSKLPQIDLIGHIVGKSIEEFEDIKQHKPKEISVKQKATFLKAEGIAKERSIAAFDLKIKRGEIVGLAGLLGSGRTEIARLLFGIDKKDAGMIKINDQECNIRSPRDAILKGIALCPEDRKKEGLVGELSVKENITLALQAKQGWLKRISPQQQQKIADHFIEAIKIKVSDINMPVQELSGGNQQKVVLARWLASKPECLILDEPTRGVDVGARAEIEKIIQELCDQGLALLVIASELEEVVDLSERILLLKDRRVVAELKGDEISASQIMNIIAEA